MAKEKQTLQDKSDRELMILQLESIRRTERDIERIKNNVIFYFYAGLIAFILFILASIK